jgi:Uma2 family endonuclease
MVITTSPLVKTYTLKEFWELPEPSDHSKLELIKGVLYMTPPPDYPHNRVNANLNELLGAEIRRWGYRGKLYNPRTALWINDDTYLEPDLIYLSIELEAQMPKKHWTRADIVVEIISPSNANYDRKTKSDTYQAMGIREMWLIDNEAQEIEVRSFQTGDNTLFKTVESLRSGVLSQIQIPVSAVFE